MPTGVLKIGAYNKKPCEALKRADIIVVDKINMCRIDVFEYVVRTLQNLRKRAELANDMEHSKKQIILAGDFYKAPPILRKEDKKAFVREWGFKRETDLFAFNSSLWDELALESVILEDAIQRDNVSTSTISTLNSENSDKNETDAEPSRIFTVVSTFYNDISDSKILDSSHFRKIRATDYEGWNEEEDTLLQEEWSRGLGIDEISRLHGRTLGAVRARLIKI